MGPAPGTSLPSEGRVVAGVQVSWCSGHGTEGGRTEEIRYYTPQHKSHPEIWRPGPFQENISCAVCEAEIHTESRLR